MLMRLLHLIGRGGLQNPAALATELNVSPDLVEAMLADLERMGYLARPAADCGPSACASCPVGCAGGAATAAGVQLLTSKGVQILKKQAE